MSRRFGLGSDEEQHWHVIDEVYGKLAQISSRDLGWDEIGATAKGLERLARGGPGVGPTILFTASPEDGKSCPTADAPAPIVVAWSVSGGGVECPRTVRYSPNDPVESWMAAVADAVKDAVSSAQ